MAVKVTSVHVQHVEASDVTVTECSHFATVDIGSSLVLFPTHEDTVESALIEIAEIGRVITSQAESLLAARQPTPPPVTSAIPAWSQHTDRDYAAIVDAGLNPDNVQPREHAVLCQQCRTQTMNISARCDDHYIAPAQALMAVAS